MQFTLRPASNVDRDAVANLVFSILTEYGLTPEPNGIDSDLMDIDGTYQATGGMFEVLVDGTGQLVGTVGLFPVSPSICELRKMYLSRSARGQGLGRQLLEHALARATALGFTRMELETASVLREAIMLYERYGFRRYAPAHLAARCDRAYYLELIPPKTP
jgi:putative acetyltransferase